MKINSDVNYFRWDDVYIKINITSTTTATTTTATTTTTKINNNRQVVREQQL